MSKIKIKNFGPIKKGYQDNDGWLDIKKVTVFIGNQGSGKSTVAKLISTFTWIEKALVRGDYDKKWFEKPNRLKNQFLPYHRLDNYLNKDTEIEYQGNVYTVKYNNGLMSINETANENYPLPQIMYVPAERNFLTYIKGAKELKLSSESLQEFNTEYNRAKETMKGVIRLPINDMEVEYNKQFDNLYLKGADYKIEIKEASSGFQSFVPLYLVSSYLADSVKKHSENKESMSSEEMIRFQKGVQEIWNNNSMTDEQKRAALSVLSSKFNKTAFVNIVEEPEQNLFPTSQREMLQSLLEFNNMNEDNKLIITTHSPYLISYLTLAIKGKKVFDDILEENKELLIPKIAEVISLKSFIDTDSLCIYEIDEKTGIIKSLSKYNGIPSDNNFLNNLLAETNNLYANLQEIEEENED
jgi:predicted ATPase